MTSIFSEFGIILGVATGMALLMRLLRQPLIIGHIITGIIVGPLFWNILQSEEVFTLFSEMGIAFLLFTVGLNLNPKVLKDYGKTAIVSGVAQVVLTSAVGFLVCRALGFPTPASLYISVAISFSSTIIILKLISDKGDLERLYAKIAIGFLLVQDLIAFALLFSLPLLTAPEFSWLAVARVFGKAILLIAVVASFAKIVVSRIHPYLTKSSEMLFLFATAWGLGIAVLFREFGLPLETGALVGGVSLAILPARDEMAARLSPLRDFFIIIFFVLLGTNLQLASLSNLFSPAIILSALVLIGNPLILMAIMGMLGYRKKTSLETGVTVAQISEFSLILVALGVSLGQVDASFLSLTTIIGLITIFGSTYLILYSEFWYRLLRPVLGIFERKHTSQPKEKLLSPEVIIFGIGRIGFDFIETFRERGEKLLVVDHDPETIRRLEQDGVSCLFGDAGDPELLDSIDMSEAEMIISTIPDVSVNLLILRRARRESEVPVLAVSHSITNALKLYSKGASYVVLPHFLGASYASNLAKKLVEDTENAGDIRDKHIAHLKRRVALGHEHPVIERYR